MNRTETNKEVISYREIHPNFRLNGNKFDHDELKEVAYSLIKEGEPFEKSIGDFLLDWLDNTSVIHVKTSGSTGKPKLIALKKRHMLNSALATGKFFGLYPGDLALLCLPVDYIAGKMMLVRAMILGLELDYLSVSSNPLAETSKSYDFCAMVPLQVENSLERLHQIKCLIVGGAPLSSTLMKHLRNQVGLPERNMEMNSGLLGLPSNKANRSFETAVYETYGMSETITHVAIKKVIAPQTEIDSVNKIQTSADTEPSLGKSEYNVRGSVSAEPRSAQNTFQALPNVNFTIDARGCLIIDAPEISESSVVTNDMVRLISKTEFEWLGRYDNVINSGGVKLFPERIEAKLAEFIPARFFVTGIPDDKLGQQLILVVEGDHDTNNLHQTIKDKTEIDNFEVPKKIYLLPEFRSTPNGKIQRSETLDLISVW